MAEVKINMVAYKQLSNYVHDSQNLELMTLFALFLQEHADNLQIIKDKTDVDILMKDHYVHTPDIISYPAPKEEVGQKVWAWLLIKGEEKLMWYNSTTEKGYWRKGYEATNDEIKDFKFIRFATTFDL